MHSDIPGAGHKKKPRRPGAELEEKDFSGNEKGRQWCRPLRASQDAWRQLLLLQPPSFVSWPRLLFP